MGIEINVAPLPDEDPAFGRMRFVCDYCGQAMLSRDGIALELPLEHGGEGHSNMRDVESEEPAPIRYYVHRVGCEWHFIHERGWTPEHYSSHDITLKD